jgi:hypothetical protein
LQLWDSQTGSAAGGTFLLRTGRIYSRTNANIAGFNWNRGLEFTVPVFLSATTGNGIFRCQTKTVSSTTLGQMTSAGVGYEIRSNTIWLTAHNGTTLTEVNTGVTLPTGSNSALASLRVVALPTGRVELYNTEALIGFCNSCGPTTVVNGGANGITLEATNGGDAANMRVINPRNVSITEY